MAAAPRHPSTYTTAELADIPVKRHWRGLVFAAMTLALAAWLALECVGKAGADDGITEFLRGLDLLHIPYSSRAEAVGTGEAVCTGRFNGHSSTDLIDAMQASTGLSSDDAFAVVRMAERYLCPQALAG